MHSAFLFKFGVSINNKPYYYMLKCDIRVELACLSYVDPFRF